MEKNYKLNDKVIMKKPHACQTNLWEIIRCGVDHVLRGGCVKNNDIVCRVSSRNAGSSGMVGLIGIRLVLR